MDATQTEPAHWDKLASGRRQPAARMAPLWAFGTRTSRGTFKIIAQRFKGLASSPPLADGSPLEIRTSASSGPVSTNSRARIAALGSSRFVVVWNGPGAGGADDVYGQLIVLGGTGLSLVGSRFTVNTLTAGTQTAPAVTSPSSRDPNTPDRFVVTWQDCIGGASCSDFSADPVGFDGDRSGIAAQVFQVSGGVAQKMGTFFAVNTTVEGRQQAAAAAMDSAGKWAAAWEDLDGADGDGSGVLARRFDQTNSSLPDLKLFEGNVNQDGGAPPSIHQGTSLDSDANDFITAVWDDDKGGSQKNIYLARLAPDGRRLPLDPNDPNSFELRVNDANDPNTAQNIRPQVAVEPSSGRGVVAWVHQATAGSDGDVRYRQFSVVAGKIVLAAQQHTVSGSVVLVSTISNGLAPADIAANQAPNWNTNGRFAVSWEGKEGATNNTDIFVRVYRGDDSAPNPDPGLITVNDPNSPGSQQLPSLGMDAAGNFTAVFRRAGATGGVAYRRFTPNGVSLTVEMRVDTLGYDVIDHPAISGVADGRAFISWRGQLTGTGHLQAFGRWFDASGTALGPSETGPSTNSTLPANPVGKLSGSGDLIVAWSNEIDNTIRFRRFDSSRNPRDPNEVTAYSQSTSAGGLFPSLTTTPHGDSLILHNGVLPTNRGGTSVSDENNDLFIARLTPEGPAAAFDSTPPVCSNGSTSFTDLSSTNGFTSVAGRKWDLHYTGSTFDSEATQENPQVVYPNASSNFDVLLRITDDRATGRTGYSLMSLATTQLPARPTPAFTKTVNTNRVVDFSACTACGGYGSPFSYDWIFGDGVQDLGVTTAMRSHEYPHSGQYTALLTVRDSMGCPGTSPASSNFDVLPVIHSVTADLRGEPVAGPNDTIVFELLGDPNRVGSVSLDRVGGGFNALVNLTEAPPGSGDYVGSYTVLAGTGQFDVNVTGILSEPGGVRQATKLAAGTLPIDTVPPALPVITKDVGLGPGAGYTTANPRVQISGTTSTDTQSIVVTGLAAINVVYAPGQNAWSANGTLSSGQNAVFVQARDLAENSSAARTMTVTLDQVSPVTLDDRASGGTIGNLDQSPAATVFFPPGVLRQPTPYTPAQVSLIKNPTPSDPQLGPGIDRVGLFGWELRPNESFNGLATVTLRYSDGDILGLNEAKLTVAFLDQNLNQWRQDGVFIDSLNAAQNTIVFKTQHFTFFTFAEGAQPPPPTPTPTPRPMGSYPVQRSEWLPLLALLAAVGALSLRKAHP